MLRLAVSLLSNSGGQLRQEELFAGRAAGAGAGAGVGADDADLASSALAQSALVPALAEGTLRMCAGRAPTSGRRSEAPGERMDGR